MAGEKRIYFEEEDHAFRIPLCAQSAETLGTSAHKQLSLAPLGSSPSLKEHYDMRQCKSSKMPVLCSFDVRLCRLNKCGVISPRYDIKHGDLEAWVARLLPSRLVSYLLSKLSA